MLIKDCFTAVFLNTFAQYVFKGDRIRHARLNPPVRLGLEVRLSQRTQLLLGYQRFLQPFEGAEVAVAPSGLSAGRIEGIGITLRVFLFDLG